MKKPKLIPTSFLEMLNNRCVFRMRRYKDKKGREVIIPQKYILERKRMCYEARMLPQDTASLKGLAPVKDNDGPFLLDPRPLYSHQKHFHTVISEYFLLNLDEPMSA